jgi:APA family basic amino acid/polyamine antiporter
VTVTKLAGMAILGAGATIINSLFSSDAWITLLYCWEIKEPKEYSSQFVSDFEQLYYVLANIAYLALLPIRNPNAADIANNGIMFASNDRGGGCKYDYGKCVLWWLR